ncbi:GNAT family N-acetyltransferase [Nitrosopumilus maritimus]|uniref:GCN5-related N-acetyltransferase n=1 Tax=Nitrosopumilus maritimus (strain SCM1) TaxID=436308 RepID=A9A470_NITMS|nr:GNAT family N-acetyltransferase [Nitrosopumilus maritimus]ABX12254.1 GCN5-related N-acetyltransferase [Nitrosopumilus maritimus SCM1]
MTNVTIREATDKDIPIILGLLYELGRPKPQQDSDVDSFRKLVKTYIQESDKKLLVAILDDMKIVGMISMMLLPRLNRDTLEMYVPELIVLEKYQGKGIGKKLINSCITFAIEKKCHRIRLESGNQRKESHKFYKHLGFEQSSLSFTKNL